MAESHTNDPERPALTVVAGSDAQVSLQDPEGAKVDGEQEPTDAIARGEATAITEQPANSNKSLEDYRRTLLNLVQKGADTTPDPGFILARILTSGAFSASLYGRRLSSDVLVGEYANLLPLVKLPVNAGYVETALIGLMALKTNRLKIAQAILEDIKFATSTPVAITFVMRGILRFVTISLGVVYLGFLIGATLTDFNIDISKHANVINVLLAATFGCAGGVVSLLIRLAEFEKPTGRSRQFLLLSGTTLPIIGGIFAAVLAALLCSKIVTFGADGSTPNAWLFMVLGFLAGFSERFTRNLLRLAENQLSPPTEASNAAEPAKS